MRKKLTNIKTEVTEVKIMRETTQAIEGGAEALRNTVLSQSPQSKHMVMLV